MSTTLSVTHKPYHAPHPLMALLVSLAAGLIAARFGKLSLSFAIASGGLSTALALYFFVKAWPGHATLFLMLAFFSLGATLEIVETKGISPDRIRRIYDEGKVASGDAVEVTGVLNRAPEPAPDGFYLELSVERIRIRGEERSASGVISLFANVRSESIRAEYDALELRYGARVNVMTALRRTEGFRNPGVSSFIDYLEQRGLDATGTIKSPLLVERLDDQRVFLPLAWLYEWRRKLLASLDDRFSPDTAGVLEASLLGNRYHLSQAAAERFRDGGTFHVLVISGLHISFIGLMVLGVMRRVTRRRDWQFTVTVAILWSYTIAVGAEASVVRAALMFTIIALAPVLHRRASSLNALGGAGLALLAWRPADLFDPSFQLTFLSVLAIVAIAWPLLRRLQEIGTWRPTRATPSPPVCARWWRNLGELLFWSEREWREEMKHSPWHCRLFKSPCAARLEEWHVQWVARYVVSVVVVSATVQLMLLPFLVIYFHRLSLASVVLNIIVGVLMALLSICGLIAVLVSQFSSELATPFVALTEGITWLMIHSVDPFARIRLASIRLPEYTGWASSIYGLYYVPLVVLTFKLSYWNPFQRPSSQAKQHTFGPISFTRLAAVAFVLVFATVVWHPLSARAPDGRLHIDFLDVGQGDSALVTTPDGTTILIDGGGQPSFDKSSRNASEDLDTEPFERDRRSIGESVVSEYLWWRGLGQVDFILATHADADHMDGLNAVARNFKVGSALIARTPANDVEYARFASTLSELATPVQLIARGDSMKFGAVTVDVLWPVRISDANAPSRNDDSVVLRLGYGDRRFLLTGDIEAKAEAILARAPDELRCDVIKVAHHGSKSSSIGSFVGAARPSVAVVSVGLFSIYGHPDRNVVESWSANGAEVLTTGRSGTISVSTDGKDLRLSTFVNQSPSQAVSPNSLP